MEINFIDTSEMKHKQKLGMFVLFIIIKYTIAKENQRTKINQSEVIDAEDLKLLEQNKVNIENPHLRLVFSFLAALLNPFIASD